MTKYGRNMEGEKVQWFFDVLHKRRYYTNETHERKKLTVVRRESVALSSTAGVS